MNIADQSVFDLVNSSFHLDERGLTKCLDSLYENASVHGLNPTALHTLVDYLLTSEILGLVTKEYLVKNCLIPREHVKSETIRLIMIKLGTPTVFDPYKLCCPKILQEALVSWVFHIYPWVKTPDIFKNDFSQWFELWKFDYLQQWVTYILIWSCTPERITKWRCKVLYKIGNNPGYKDSNAYSAFLLKSFLSLCSNDMRSYIEDLVDQLNANERKLKRISTHKYDKIFFEKMRKSKIRSGTTTSLDFDTIMKAYFQDQYQTSGFDSPYVCEVEYLAGSWETHVLPYDINIILKDTKPATWLLLAALPLQNHRIVSLVEFLKYSSDSKMLLMKNPFLRILDLELGFELGSSTLLRRDGNISLFLKSLEESSSEQMIYEKAILEITNLVVCHKSSPRNAKPSDLLSYLLMYFIDKMFDNKSETVKMLICLILRLCSSIEDANMMTFVHVLGSRSLEQLLAIGEPLIYNYLCHCLTYTMRNLSRDNNELIAQLHEPIQLTINYLWKSHQLISNKSSLVPPSFWNVLATNQHFTQNSVPSHALFTLPNMFCMQNVFHKLLFNEEEKHAYVHYNGKFTESGFKNWNLYLRKNNSLNWFSNIGDFRKFLLFLLELLRQDGRYSAITNFILTNENEGKMN